MKTIVVLAVALLISCMPVTVNITFQFPEKEMGKALLDMEKDVRGKAPEEKKQGGIILDNAAILCCYAPAIDDDKKMDIEVNTPAIRAIKERRTKRFPNLKPHFAKGLLGEGNDATVKIRSEEGLAAKEKADFKKLVSEENGDRDALLKEILKANKLDETHLPKLRKIYAADALHKVAEKGWWIETDGGWKQKE